MNNLINLNNRVIDEEGNVVYFSDALIEMLYNGEIPCEILYPLDDPDIEAFNKFSYENFDDIYYKLPEKLPSLEERKNEWFYPDKYNDIDLYEYFYNLKSSYTEQELERINLELNLYLSKGMEKFLRCCIFLSERIKEEDWVIGVGRGSSCASYLLYILGIHLVDSIKYNLDIKEFLK